MPDWITDAIGDDPARTEALEHLRDTLGEDAVEAALTDALGRGIMALYDRREQLAAAAEQPDTDDIEAALDID